MMECNKIIFNDNIKNIYFESCNFLPLFMSFQYPLELRQLYITINTAINSNKHKYYNLEYNSKYHFSDDVEFICESIINPTLFILFSKPYLALKIMSCIFLYDITNTLTINMDYKTKLLLSKYLFFDTYIYRRDKER
jgi:hypothetical protein